MEAVFETNREGKEVKETEGERIERECFGEMTKSQRFSFSWAHHPVSLLWYLHTKPINVPSVATDLFSLEPCEKEQARTGLVWAPGTWTEVYFLTRLVVGTEATVQNQGSHRTTKKHRGQGLRNHESCDAAVLTQMTTAALLAWSEMWRERCRKREGSPCSEWFHWRWFLINAGSTETVMCYDTRQFPVPTVEYLPMGFTVGSRSGPDGQAQHQVT